MDFAKASSAINDLLTRSHDAYKGYQAAAADAQEKKLEKHLEGIASKRGNYILDLQMQIKSLGGTPQHGTSVLGDLHRTWSNWKSKLTKGDTAILKECIRGERRILQEYDRVLKNVQLNSITRKVLKDHRRNIHDTLLSLRTMEKVQAVAY